MREVISLHIGQAGVQIGGALWELYCAEHGIEPNGELEKEKEHSMGLGSFFRSLPNGKFTPRTIFADLEPTVIDELKTGKYKNLYSNSFIEGDEDAANNYARGYYTVGRQSVQKTMEAIRDKIAGCEQCQGFMIYHSLGGGTGSGFVASLLEEIVTDYPKHGLLEIAIYPSPTMSTAVVEPYNTILSTHCTMETSKCVVLTDNESMYKICTDKLEIDQPNYKNINGVLAQAVSAMTTGMRFEGDLMADFLDFQTNLVPFPRLHFPIVSLAPVIGNTVTEKEPSTIPELTGKCFDSSYRLTNCDNEWGKYISCCLMYRGDVTPKDINESLASIKSRKNINFVEWCPTGFKVSINSQAPASLDGDESCRVKRSVCMLCNNTSIKDSWQSLVRKYDAMTAKGAFYHWYLGEGMEQSEFFEAGENIKTLVKDYEELLV
ncbi:tubulin alpha chain-like [Cimex lectularius]|uniref:Tubulin alpha chain n=1 Tax=Cimex lectularius TaxID=79782 RepID=A0A8I6RU23_CIMLE|nr:tubulin alpha chain-like [Cimex lectularius]